MVRALFCLASLGLAAAGQSAAAQATIEEASAATISAVYTADAWRNLSGGARAGATYLDNFDLVAAFDAERSLGLTGTTAQVSLLYNNRKTFSDRYAGDLQTISNIDTDGSLRLYEAWVDHDFGAGAVKVGVIDLNSEFDVNETGALFINSSHGIGPEFSQVGANGPGVFPIPALGGRLALRHGQAELKLGVFEGTPGDSARPRRTVLKLERGEGSLTVVEATARTDDGLRLGAGWWRHGGSPREGLRAAHGAYAIAEKRLLGGKRGSLSAFVRTGMARGRTYQVASYQGLGLALQAPLLTGAEEQLGLAVASVRNSRSFRRAQSAAGSSSDARETALEMTYRTRLTPWLALQPDLQYILNPGTDPSRRNAVAVGLRVELGWTWSR